MRRSTMTMIRLCLLLSALHVSPALDMGLPDLSEFAGYDVGAGATHSQNRGWGALAELHGVALIVNGSVEVVRSFKDEDFNYNVYMGVGIGPMIQVQRGFEDAMREHNRGSTRIRSMINLSHLVLDSWKDHGFLLSCFGFPQGKNPFALILSPYCELYDSHFAPSEWRLGVTLGLTLDPDWILR